MTLFYLPLESYKERYTLQWSAPVTGWLERRWRQAGIAYRRIEGAEHLQAPRPIKTGCVLDAVKRSQFCFSQLSELLTLAEEGQVTDEDVIYLDDFWTPGFSALPYCLTLLGVRPKIFAFLHAQSVDEFDFTYPMRQWMRHFETGQGQVLDGIFVCGPCLQELVVRGGIASASKVHVTGHPFCSDEVRERMPDRPLERQNQVVFSSRWDREKNPDFFLRVAHRVLQDRPQARFVVCTSSPTIRSNDPHLITLLHRACQEHPGQIVLKENLSKEQYYAELCRSKIQCNTASQDFVAITLLEASVAGCYPLYPWFRSFPETLFRRTDYLYEMLDEQHLARKIIAVLDRDDLWTPEALRQREWIHSRFDTSWLRMTNLMGLTQVPISDPYQEQS